jgi:hypothetical protein
MRCWPASSVGPAKFYVAFLFNTYDRLADTLGWELPDARYYPKAGRFLLAKGYR